MILYRPLLNALAFLVSVIPGGDVGIAVILLTILVKLLLFPVSERQLRNQAAMTMLAPELNKIKASGKSKEEQARLTFELYRKHKTNPFAGCLLIIPTIIIIIALYRVFIQGLNFESGLLYSFIHLPVHINTIFLGLIDISKKSIILAVLAGVSQYLQGYYMPKPPAAVPSAPGGFADSFNSSMQLQMKYFFPFLMVFFAYYISGAVALYLITNNLFTLGQQIYVKRTEKKTLDAETEALVSKT